MCPHSPTSSKRHCQSRAMLRDRSIEAKGSSSLATRMEGNGKGFPGAEPNPSSGAGMLCRVRSGGATRSAKHRSEEHTSELQSLMRISYAVFCLKKKKKKTKQRKTLHRTNQQHEKK